MSKTIKLSSRKYPDFECIVDDEDYENLSNLTWYPQTTDFYKSVYAISKIDGKFVRMHRYIMMLHNINIENVFVDHIDLNGLNNCKHNLRICTNGQNQHNSRKPINGLSSVYKGVCFDKRRDKFIARISFENRRITIGRYTNEQDAALAYNEKAIELFGEFALLNTVSDEGE